MTDQDLAPLRALREPFPAEAIGLLPRKAGAGPHRRAACSECGTTHEQPAIHLHYVGHAGVTDRLLTADLAWDWQPVAWAADGTLAIAEFGGQLALWIRLTVCGVTRLGVGTCERSAPNPLKELIGDAIRNAAMRFGVALDLWAREELESQQHEDSPDGDRPRTRVLGKGVRDGGRRRSPRQASRQQASPVPGTDATDAAFRERLLARAAALIPETAARNTWLRDARDAITQDPSRPLSRAELEQLEAMLDELERSAPKEDR